jgi:protein-tyrosine phosphatase
LIDLHSHVLPGIDDGPPSIDGSLDILRAAQADGITRIAATPHVRHDYPTTAEQMELAVVRMRETASASGIAVDLLTGGELDLAYAETLDDVTLRRFGLGGNPNLLLLEFPYVGGPVGLPDLVFRLRVRGFGVVLAHPERNADVQERPERLRELVDAGVCVQLTAASVDGRLGRRNAAGAKALLDAGLAHLIASDAHAPAIRAIGMGAAAEAVGDDALVRWLTHDVPSALLAGDTLPARPVRAKGRVRLPWRRH